MYAFCLLLGFSLYTGFSWKNSSSFSLEVSPQPAATVTNSLISVEDFHNRLSSYGISPGSESPRCVFVCV